MKSNLKTFIITTVAASSMAVIGFATAPAGIAGGRPPSTITGTPGDDVLRGTPHAM